MLIQTFRPRQKPPGNLVMQLRRGHPLAQAARAVIVMGGQFGLGRDLVSGAVFTGANTPTIAINPEGPTADVSGTAYLTSPHRPDWAVLGEITVAWRGLIRNPSGLGNLICKIPFAGGGGANTPFSLETSNPTANAVSFGRSNSNYRVWQSGTAPLVSTAVSSISVSQPATIETAPIFYFNGVQDSVAAANQYGGAGSGAPTDTGSDLQIGRRPDGAEQLDGQPLIAIVSAMQWSAGQHLLFGLDPYAALEEATRYYFAGPLSSGITGTGAATLGNVTSSGAGALALSGAGSATLGRVTATGAGALALSGTGAGVLRPVSSSASGALALAGSASATLGRVTSTAAGALALAGTGAGTLRPVTATAAGALALAGTGAGTLGALTGAGAGTFTMTGTGAATLANVSGASAGTLLLQGSASILLGAVVSAAAGSLPLSGSAAAVLRGITGSSSAMLALGATASVTLGNVTGAGSNAPLVPGVPAPAFRTVTWPLLGRGVVWSADSRVVTWPVRARTVTWQG